MFTTATYIGYLLRGAFFAAFRIFMSGFLLVALSGPPIPKIRYSPLASAILDGVVMGSMALLWWCVATRKGGHDRRGGGRHPGSKRTRAVAFSSELHLAGWRCLGWLPGARV
jgi:hypothetical protein